MKKLTRKKLANFWFFFSFKLIIQSTNLELIIMLQEHFFQDTNTSIGVQWDGV